MAPADGTTQPPGGAVTALLRSARAGDPAAAEELFALVYADLKRVARRQLVGQRPGETISATVLVHEAFLRLAKPGALEQNDRQHFFAVASRAMRQILVDHARRKSAEKRGGGRLAVELDEGRLVADDARTEELLAVDAALERLAALDPRLAQVVEWRFFGGLTLEEIGAALGLTERTIKRDWRKARAFLFRELQQVGVRG